MCPCVRARARVCVCVWRTCSAPHSIAPPGVTCVTKQLLNFRTRVSQLSSIDEQSGSSAHNHSTTLVPGRAAAAPGPATAELDSTHMNGLTADKKRSVVPTAQSKVCVYVCVCVCVNELMIARVRSTSIRPSVRPSVRLSQWRRQDLAPGRAQNHIRYNLSHVRKITQNAATPCYKKNPMCPFHFFPVK